MLTICFFLLFFLLLTTNIGSLSRVSRYPQSLKVFFFASLCFRQQFPPRFLVNSQKWAIAQNISCFSGRWPGATMQRKKSNEKQRFITHKQGQVGHYVQRVDLLSKCMTDRRIDRLTNWWTDTASLEQVVTAHLKECIREILVLDESPRWSIWSIEFVLQSMGRISSIPIF